MQAILLNDVLTIFGLSVAVLYICHRVRVPTVVGFLLTGLLAGPHGLGLVKALNALEILAEVGVVLLLFIIGLEFSLRNLWKIRKLVFVAGFSQVLLTFAATLIIVRALGRPAAEAVFIGFLVSLSSTAIVMKILQEKAEVESPHGQATLGILIFQDIIVVPMMLFTPLLAGTTGNLSEAFRDVFTSFFFVSVGMLLDLNFLLKQPEYIGLIAVGILLLKTCIAGLAVTFTGLPLRTVVLIGVALSQVDEFSFILSRAGVEYGLLTPTLYQMFLAVSVLTMAATPFVMAVAPSFADTFLRLPFLRRLKRGSYPLKDDSRAHEKDHLIIIGFGINGRNLARAARVSGIPYVIVEMNPQAVREEKAKGEPIYYGDATQEAVLKHARIKEARVVVSVINDPTATRRITELARRLNRKVHIIVRTRFLREMGALYDLGANEVIPEEFETSVEIFTRVLGKYLQPKEEIEKFIHEVRSENYGMFRTISREASSCMNITHCLPDFEIVSLRVGKKSAMLGKTLA